MLTLACRAEFRALLVLLSLAACAEDSPETPPASAASQMNPGPAAPTHSGIVSIQDVTIANLPEAGHGLTVQALFTPIRAPDVVEAVAGTPFGCRASAYDLATEPLPPEQNQGTLTLEGLRGGAIDCRFRDGRGYTCPTASGSSMARVDAASGAATYALEAASLTQQDVGRYLQISGASQPQNNGAFAIVAVMDPHTIAVGNPRAMPERFQSTYAVVAGVGPTPRDPYSPFEGQSQIRASLEAGGNEDFDAFDVQITPGGPMTLDRATQATIVAIQPNAETITLGCSGDGGECGAAAATVLRISTTDGDTTGLSPVAMPPSTRWVVEIQCAYPDAGEVEIPAAAMALLNMAHEQSPITRIRTAFMREGFALATNAAPRPGNAVNVLVGHGVLGFSNPGRD